MHQLPRFLLLCLLPTLSLISTSANARPEQVVSLSLCSDELLLRLADRDQIASLTWLAAEPEYSPVAALAGGIPLNRGLAEEVLAFAPDLILSTDFSATGAVRLLRSLGHEVEVLPLPLGVADSFEQIRRAGILLEQQARAEQLTGQMRTIMESSQQFLQAQPARRALFLSPNGLTYGGGTLRDDFLQSIGWINVAAELGLQGPGRLPLENLLASNIDMFILTTASPHDTWLAHALPEHPAIEYLMDKTESVVLPDAWFQCAGPSVVQAWESLASQLGGQDGNP